MIQTVVKRDGRIVGFNEEKIMATIRRAMLHMNKLSILNVLHDTTVDGPCSRTAVYAAGCLHSPLGTK